MISEGPAAAEAPDLLDFDASLPVRQRPRTAQQHSGSGPVARAFKFPGGQGIMIMRDH